MSDCSSRHVIIYCRWTYFNGGFNFTQTRSAVECKKVVNVFSPFCRKSNFRAHISYIPVHLVESMENCGLYTRQCVACSSYQIICIGHLLLHVRFILTAAPCIKLCAIASYYLFHFHAQVITFTNSTR